MSKVGEFDLRAQVDPDPWPSPDERSECSAVLVVPFQPGVGERHDLGKEAVGAHEPGQSVTESILVFVVEGEESVDCGLECCVDLVVFAVAQKQRDRSFNLASVEHVELVEGLASVEHQFGSVGGATVMPW